jgi:hypothetical protein
VQVSHQVSRDPALISTRRILYTALPFLVAALALLYLMAPHDSILPPSLMWSLGVTLSTLWLLRRPMYPYWRSDGGPTLILTPAQGRTLAFLKSRRGRRFSLWLGGYVTALIPLAVGLGLDFPFEYPLLKDYATWSRPHQLGASGITGLAAAGLGILGMLFLNSGASAWYILCNWDWIQARYDPWPLGRLGREFCCLARWHELRQVRYTDRVSTASESWSRPSSWRERVSFLCDFVGGIGLTLSSSHLVTVIIDPHRYPYPEGAAKRLLILPLFFLGILGLGRYLNKHRAGAPRRE